MADAQPTPVPAAPDECDVLAVTVRALRDGEVEVAAGDFTCTVPNDQLLGPAQVGQSFDVFLERHPDVRGALVGSPKKALRLREWDALAGAVERDEEIEGEVIAKVQGGLSVDIGVRAFLPASQVELRQVDDLGVYIGQRLRFHVLKFTPKRGSVVLTRRRVLEKEREGLKAQTLTRLKEGEVLTGVVQNFTTFGAFVDVGGIDGLVHLADLGWGRVERASDVLKVGQEIRVKVLKFEKDRERLSLGYKQLLEDPWAKVEKTYPVGSTVRGPVTSVAEYGAFVELEPGIEGLVHVSELSWTSRPKHARELVQRGQQVTAKVLEIDLAQRRVALGIKQTQENPWVGFAAAHPEGSKVRGTVQRVKEFGAFVQVEGGLEGLLHASDLAWERTAVPSEVVQPGQELELVVLEVDPSRERLSLGLKQLTGDPWKLAEEKYAVGTKVTGKVTRLEDYGAFVELEPGMEGLCHVSQLRAERTERPGDVVKVGQMLETAVVAFDRRKHKISLSVRALTEAGEDYKKYLRDEGQEGFGKVLGEKLAALKGE